MSNLRGVSGILIAIFLAFLFSNLVLTVNAASSPPACGFSPRSGRLIINFDTNSGLRADYGENEATKVVNGVYIPAGNYKIGLHSWDDHFDKYQPDQTREQYFVKFLNSGNEEIARSNPVDDIPDNAESVVQIVNNNLLIPQNVNSLVLRHSAWSSSNPNSLLPICISLDLIAPPNQPPVITSCTPPSSVNLGDTVTINYNIYDPDGDSVTVKIRWGDGTTSAGGASSATHRYVATGTFAVTIEATDSKGAAATSNCQTITVTLLPPQADTGTVIVDVNLPQAAYFIHAPDQNFGWNGPKTFFNRPVGDYCIDVPDQPGYTKSVNPTCGQLTKGGTLNFRIVFTPIIPNNPPIISSCSPSSQVILGNAATINYAVIDLDGDSFVVLVDWGDGTVTTGSLNSASHVYSAVGTFTVTITAIDSKGASATRACSTITVIPVGVNHPPQINSCSPSSPVILGNAATISYSITDPDGDSFTVLVDWGDGTTSAGGQNSATHVYAAAGTYQVRITATDSKGASATRACSAITVTTTGGNNPPSIISCTPPATVGVGQSATISYSITDPDGDSFTVSINWGDGTTSTGGQSSASHVYLAAGTYTVTITATDSKGASSSRSCGSIMASSSCSLPPGTPALKIISVDAKVDGKSSNNLHDGDTIRRKAGPESKVELKVTVRSMYTPSCQNIKIRDIQVTGILEGIYDGEDLEEESNEFDLSAGAEKRVTLKFDTLPLNIDEGTYNVNIEAEGRDDNGDDQSDSINLDLEVEKDKHDLRFLKLVSSKVNVNCNGSFAINYELINLGTEDETNAYVQFTNSDLGIDVTQKGLSISSGVDQNTISKSQSIRIQNSVSDGSYPITADAFADNGQKTDSKTIQLNVNGCGQPREETTEQRTTVYTTNAVQLVGTETIEKTLQIPIISILFKGTNRSMMLVLISTLILSIFFVLVAVVLMARSEEE